MVCSKPCSPRCRSPGEPRSMALTGRAALAALIGALVVLAFRTAAVLLIVNGLVLAAIAADLVLAGSVRPLRMTRFGDTRVLLGETASITLTVENPGRRPVRAIVRDSWQPSAHARPGRVLLRIPPRGRATLTTALTPDRRGEKRPAAVTVRSFGPCGLAARQGRHVVPWAVRVLPPFRSRRHLPEKLSRLRQLEGQHRSLLRGQGTEFDSLREYVIGDDVRSIDWRAAARSRDLMVRTWRPERDRRILVVLDTGRTSAGRVGGVPRLDSSMDATLLLAALASRAGDRIDMIAFDRRVRARVLGATRLTVLASRNLVMIAAVADPKLDELAAARGDAPRVYAAAAAERARAERQRISARLRRRGVQVVDAPPDRLPAALADAYLALKATGRL